MHVDLGGKDFEDGRERQEMLGQSKNGSASSTFGQLLDKEGDESDPDDQPNGDDTSLDPRKDGSQVVTSGLTG